MDIFQGNKKLEEVTFAGLNHALWNRYNQAEPFALFMLLHQGENMKIVRLFVGGDPNVAFANSLEKATETYDQIVCCMEGRIEHEGKKQDAIFVKVFDSSHEKGLMFSQRFRGIESGQSFKKLGNPALISMDEPCLLYTSPSPRDATLSRMPSSA